MLTAFHCTHQHSTRPCDHSDGETSHDSDNSVSESSDNSCNSDSESSDNSDNLWFKVQILQITQTVRVQIIQGLIIFHSGQRFAVLGQNEIDPSKMKSYYSIPIIGDLFT